MLSPHPWLGEAFSTLLGALFKEQKSVTIEVTRPFRGSWGKGQLRVLKVSESTERLQLVLGYEGYSSFRDKAQAKGSVLVSR